MTWKAWFTSKTIWLNVIAAVLTGLNYYGNFLPEGVGPMLIAILTAINIYLRATTDKMLTVSTTEAKFRNNLFQ